MQNIQFSSPKQQRQALDFSLRGRVFGYFTNIIIGAITAVILHQRSIVNGGVTPGYPWITFSIFIAIGIILGGAIAYTNFYFLRLSFFTNQITEKDITTWIHFRSKQIQENIKQVDAQIADAEDDLLKLKDRRDTLIQKEINGDKIIESLSPRTPTGSLKSI